MTNKEIKIAVVGCGAWGQNLVRNLHQLGVLHTVCDSSPEHLAAAKRIAPNVAIQPSFAGLLATPEITAVVIATPAETHASLAIAALECGKDVFVEKPMATTVGEAELMVSTARRLGRILMVGHLLLYSPMIRKARVLIAEGALGKLQHISVKRAKLGKVRAFENVLWSFACHDIAAMMYLFAQSAPTDLHCVGRSFVQPTIEDDTHLHLRFLNGGSGDIHSSWYWPDNERTYVILGDLRWLKIDEVAGRMTLYDKGVQPDLKSRDNGSSILEVESSQPLAVELGHFIDCICGCQPPLSDGANGLSVVRVLEKATLSMKTGSQVRL